MDVGYDHLLKREAQHGSDSIIDPEGANQTYTVAELRDGVHHEPRIDLRRWIARTVFLGLAVNMSGIAFEAFFLSEPAAGWLRFDSNVSLLFNIA